MKKYIYLFLLIFIFSCNTIKDIDDKKIYYDPSDNIELEISLKNYEVALSSFYNLHNNSEKFDDNLFLLKDNALKGIEKEYNECYEKKDYLEAISKAETLKLFGIDTKKSREDLILEHLEYLNIKDKKLTSIFANYYLLENNFDFLKKFLEDLKTPSRSTLLNTSVLTVWVDMGTKIEKGLSLPNIMFGTAFVVDKKRRYALTNYHVIRSQVDPSYKGISNLSVRLPRGKGERLPAKVISYSREMDLALIELLFNTKEEFNLNYSSNIEVGDKIYAMGSPMGLEKTITSGIISAEDRNLLSIGDSYQIDAAINQGNSGGPVVNENGEFIGITFAGILHSQGLNFIIPSKWVLKVLPFMYEGEMVKNKWLGFTLSESIEKLEISYIAPKSPADVGGLKTGDLLISVDSKKFDSLKDLQYYVLQKRSMAKIKYIRDEKEYETFLYPQNRPIEIVADIYENDAFRNLMGAFLGFRLEFVSDEEYRVSKVFLNSLASYLNFKVNDSILIYDFKVMKDERTIVLLVFTKKRFSGYMQAPMQLVIPFDAISFV